MSLQLGLLIGLQSEFGGGLSCQFLLRRGSLLLYLPPKHDVGGTAACAGVYLAAK